MAERIALRKMPGVQKEFSLHRPKLGPRTTARKFGDEEQDEDAADTVIDAGRVGFELTEPVQESDLAAIVDAFSAALLWAGQAKTLIEMGWRLTTMLHVLRPALLEGMALEIRKEQARELRQAMRAAGGDRAMLASDVGDHYRRALAFCRRCKDLAQLGLRGFAMIYLIKPAAIGGATNAAIGALDGKTRQAVNKVVTDARDSLDGFRNEMMRREETRRTCRRSRQSRI